jgi:hypothetical protein
MVFALTIAAAEAICQYRIALIVVIACIRAAHFWLGRTPAVDAPSIVAACEAYRRVTAVVVVITFIFVTWLVLGRLIAVIKVTSTGSLFAPDKPVSAAVDVVITIVIVLG